jgi:hypothetical protein
VHDCQIRLGAMTEVAPSDSNNLALLQSGDVMQVLCSIIIILQLRLLTPSPRYRQITFSFRPTSPSLRWNRPHHVF